MSVCLRSLIGFNWGDSWFNFALAIGKALWGRCMPVIFMWFYLQQPGLACDCVRQQVVRGDAWKVGRADAGS